MYFVLVYIDDPETILDMRVCPGRQHPDVFCHPAGKVGVVLRR